MRRLAKDMQLMVACRIANLAVGLLMIPLLLHSLRGEQFAGWALYVAFGMAFTTFDTASSNTLVMHVAPSARDGSTEGISRILTNGLVVLLLLYASFFPLVAAASGLISRWLYLPGSALLSPPRLIVLIYGAAMVRASLLLGQQVQFAGGNFRWYSLASFGQALAGNVASVAAAELFHHADVVIMVSWSVQLVVLAGYSLISRRRYGWSFRVAYLDGATIRRLLGHGFPLQINEWSQFFNYQFDKFLIAAMTGLWAVGPYEVANRAALALRSVPASALNLLLPTASADRPRAAAAGELYRETARFAAFGALLFIGAPLAAGWFFLFAWAGETGYHARWAFPALAGGAMAAIVALPAALLLQAEGRAEVQARAAGFSVLVNLPLSLLLIPAIGVAGAALANGMATATGAALIISGFHRLHDLPLGETLASLWKAIRWPLLIVTAVGISAATAFSLWFAPLIAVAGFSGKARVLPMLLALLVFVLCGLTVVLVARKHLRFRQTNSFPIPGSCAETK